MLEKEQSKKKIYLSGPISGYDIDERKEAFSRKQAEFEGLGFAVANPMDNGLPPDAGTHAHMKRDIEMLLDCDAIYMMSQCFHSAGCKCEFEVATAIGLDVFFEECHSKGEPIRFK